MRALTFSGIRIGHPFASTAIKRKRSEKRQLLPFCSRHGPAAPSQVNGVAARQSAGFWNK